MRHLSSSAGIAPLPLGTAVTDGHRVGILQAYRPGGMIDVRFDRTLNGVSQFVVERRKADTVTPVMRPQPEALANPAKGLKKVIRAWEKTPQARPMLSVLRGAVLNADLTPNKEQSIPADFLPETLIDSEEVQLVIGRDGTVVLLASDSPRRGAKSIRNAMDAGRTIRLTGPRGGLSEGQRAALPPAAFAVQRGGHGSWPVHDRRHAEIALNYMKRGFGRREDYPAILSEIQKRYPDLVPASNPAGRDFQDPENIQFRRVVAGITRSLVRKELGMPATPRSKEMTAAELRRDEALFLSLSPEDRRAITSKAYAIATRQGQKHGWLKVGTQQPTVRAAARSEERMLLDPLEAQKDRYYEVMLAGQRKKDFYRVVPRQVAVGHSEQTRYYIEPSNDPKRPLYFYTQAKAESRKDQMNAALKRSRRLPLRNPGPGPDDIDFDIDLGTEDLFSGEGDIGAGTQTPSSSAGASAGTRASRPTGAEGFVPDDLTIDDEMMEDLDFAVGDENLQTSPQGMAFIDSILSKMATPKNTEPGLMNEQRPQPFYDIVRKRLVDDPDGPQRADGSPAKKYITPNDTTPFDPEKDKIFFEIYLPYRVQYANTSQRGIGGNTILVPAGYFKTDLETRTRGRGRERREETIARIYSEVGRGESMAVNVNQALIDRFFSPYGSVSQKWEKYRKEKTGGGKLRGRARISRLRGLIPRPGEHLIPAKRSDPMVKVQRGEYNTETGQFENKVSMLYRKWYTTNADIFRFIVLYYRSPALPIIMSRLDSLVRTAQMEAEALAPQASEYTAGVPEEGENDLLFYVSDDYDFLTSDKSNIPMGLKELKNVPSTDEISAGKQTIDKFSKNDVPGPQGRKTDDLRSMVATAYPGLYSIPGFGPKRVSFTSKEAAVDWLRRNISELRDLYRDYLNAVGNYTPISPVTVTGVPFSAGESAISGLKRAFEKGLRQAISLGEQEAARSRTQSRIVRTTERARRKEEAAAARDMEADKKKAEQAKAQEALRKLSELDDL